ncbi:M48 family metallopeptidase [Hyphomonas sp. FCG-A18]|uniref:M48 family metallopeptidase n=1 Tax=Hyphomonas sp. FCG-A18 TaxID=3080019 RepID=UPI002B31F866|nr:M48 family metallopeptidase [Hyphomonas sp. FCG-A18]
MIDHETIENAESVEFDSAILKDAPTVRMSRRGIIKGLACGTVVPILSSCSTNPETGQSQFIMFGEQQIASMAVTAWSDMKKQTPQTSDSRLRSRVLNIWERIENGATAASASGRKWNQEDWEVAVFDTDDVNAFVMPGNKVGVYRGITELTENDDQISSVLGHELGHVAGRHAAERMSVQMASQVGLVAGSIAIAQTETGQKYGNEIAALGGAALQFGVILPYSRRHELEADKLGVDYMHKAGYDVKQAPRLWELMDAKSAGNRPPEFMSTHPDPARRAVELRNYINAKGYALI